MKPLSYNIKSQKKGENMGKHTVAVMTGTRADYGLLRPVLEKLQAQEEIFLKLFVTGSHLSHAFGYTVTEIENDGFAIAARMDIFLEDDCPGKSGTAKRTSRALQAFLKCFEEEKPQALLLLGDRYEILAAALAASLLGIPVAHISGGEVTYGAEDDWYRHCVSKMAKLHFPSCDCYRDRLLRMGEDPKTVFNVGGLGDENIRKLLLPTRESIADSLGIPKSGPLALVTFHPETATGRSAKEQAQALIWAAEQNPSLFYLFTAANADAGGFELNTQYALFCERYPNSVLVPSLGVVRYLALMKEATLVLGNSSSGVVETPSFGTPTVNIGQRQQGRIMCDNVLCCKDDPQDIDVAIKEAMSPSFQEKAHLAQSPYRQNDTSGQIVHILLDKLNEGGLQLPKQFYDGGCGI